MYYDSLKDVQYLKMCAIDFFCWIRNLIRNYGREKAKMANTSWPGHSIFQLLLCLLIFFACKIVFYYFYICDLGLFWSWAVRIIKLLSIIFLLVNQLMINYQLLSLSKSFYLLLLLLLFGYYWLLICLIRSLHLSLESIAFSLMEKQKIN